MYVEDDSREQTSHEKAARGNSGQNQKSKQASENSSSLWDTTEHSSAPGPFGTGDDEE